MRWKPKAKAWVTKHFAVIPRKCGDCKSKMWLEVFYAHLFTWWGITQVLRYSDTVICRPCYVIEGLKGKPQDSILNAETLNAQFGSIMNHQYAPIPWNPPYAPPYGPGQRGQTAYPPISPQYVPHVGNTSEPYWNTGGTP